MTWEKGQHFYQHEWPLQELGKWGASLAGPPTTGPQVTYPHTAYPPLGSQACKSTCRRWVCSDTGHWCGSHLALGHIHPHLQKSTATPGVVPPPCMIWPWFLSSIISYQPTPLHSLAKLLGRLWDEPYHFQAPVFRYGLIPLTEITRHYFYVLLRLRSDPPPPRSLPWPQV